MAAAYERVCAMLSILRQFYQYLYRAVGKHFHSHKVQCNSRFLFPEVLTFNSKDILFKVRFVLFSL